MLCAIDSATVRVLVVPVGPVRTEQLRRWAAALSVAAAAECTLRLAFVVDDDNAHEHLEGLQTYRQILGVVGVADRTHTADVAAGYDGFVAGMGRFSSAVAFRCIVFGGDSDDDEEEIDGVTAVPDGSDVAECLRVEVNEFAETLGSALALMARSVEDGDSSSSDGSVNSGRHGGELDRDESETRSDRGTKTSTTRGSGTGRLKKLRGDLLLMGGHSADALAAYAAALDSSAALGDVLWQALALEGLCAALILVLRYEPDGEQLASVHVAGAERCAKPRLQRVDSNDNVEQPPLLQRISNLLARAPPLYARCQAPLLHAEACARQARVLLALRETEPERALDILATGGPDLESGPALATPDPDVAQWAARAATALAGLEVLDQLSLVAELAAVFRAAGHARKALLFVRRFLLLATPLLLRTNKVRAPTEAAAASEFADGTAALSAVLAASRIGTVSSSIHSQASATPPTLCRAVVSCVQVLAGGLAQDDTSPGLLPLQVDVLRLCVAVSEALPSYPDAVAAALRLSQCLHRLATEQPARRSALGEELHVVKGYIHRTVALCQTSGTDSVAKDRPAGPCVSGRDAAVLGGTADSLLEGLQLLIANKPPPIRVGGDSKPATASLFLHNPKSRATAPGGEAPPLVVADERIRIVAALQNPLPFPLPISAIEPITEPATAGGLPVACTIPASGSGQVVLDLDAGAARGQLQIIGLRMRLFQQLQVDCVLAVDDIGNGNTDALRRAQRLRDHEQRLDAERCELLGIEPSSADAHHLSPMNPHHALVVEVVPPLPLLRLASSSSIAREQSLSLYEGESRIVCLELASEHGDVGRIDVAFEPLPTGEAGGDRVRAADLVDAAFSYQLHMEPASRRVQLRVRVSGLPGLHGAEVVVRYAGREIEGWSRELRHPIHVAVAPVLELHASPHYRSLPPFMARVLAGGSAVPMTDPAVEMLHGVDLADEYQLCLAELHPENVATSSVKLTFEVDLSDKAGQSAGIRTLAVDIPAQKLSSRVLVPMRRVLLSKQDAERPIPGVEADGGPDRSVFYPWRTSLSRGDDGSDEEWVGGQQPAHGRARQFVVSKNAAGDGLKTTDRMRYWYAQELAHRVRVRWELRADGRCGFVDPRLLFTLGQEIDEVVRPPPVRLVVESVGGGQMQATDLGTCPLREPSKIDFALLNCTAETLDDAVFSICCERDFEPPSLSTSLLGNQVHQRVAALVEANVNLAFASRFAEDHSSGSSDHERPRFRFCPATSGLGTARPKVAPAQVPTPPDALDDDLVFDDVSWLRLPSIPGHTTHRFSLPLYVRRPGRYHFEYAVRTSNSETQCRELVVES
ncbi:hypothetical protein GGF46_004754 [Coemansia sp. RSA 552]|nr:hypothetical protein GGF46_004754 [Coemansia sp. RSA 552]